MKRLFAVLLSCLLLFSLSACSNVGVSNDAPSSSREPERSAPSETPSEELLSETRGEHALVVYFSATGNTKLVAETLAELQGADLYEIVPERPYTDEDLNYHDPSTRASVEQNDETARPPILGGIESMEAYDVIYVGFPIWWGDMPRILYTFFDTYDLSGKTIAPFCTSGGSNISAAVQSIITLEPSAKVTEGFRAASINSADGLIQWLNEIGLAKQE